MNFERVEIEWSPTAPGSSWDDAWLAQAGLRRARASLTRHATVAAEWSLCRLAAPGSRPRVYVFPTPAAAQPPASLWIANLRLEAIERGFCQPDDAWSEIAREGWAGYGFNRLHDYSFSPSGGALDAGSQASWQEHARAHSLSELVLCALPWEGLASMWGSRAHQEAMATREGDILRREVGAAPAVPASRKGRGKKA